MSDQPESAARELPDRPSLRHLKLEAKRRLAAGEFTTLHDAQLAVAREHGTSSWTALKEHIEAGHGHALAQVRWIFGRYAEADAPGWAAPSRTELSEHFTERFLGFASPSEIATLGSIAASLREPVFVFEADATHLSAKVGSLRVEAVVEPAAPYRLDLLRLLPDTEPVADPRVTQPPSAGSGPVPAAVPGLIEASYAQLSLLGLTAVGSTGDAPWAYSRGWADVEGAVPLRSDHSFPAVEITALVTCATVLRLIADGDVALDDPANRHLCSLRLADDTVTVRDLLAHTGGVDSPPPPSLWDTTTADTAETLGQVVGCSGPRGEFAYSHGGYAVLGQLIADRTGTPFPHAATRLVLEPLGMADSWFPAEAPVPPDAARGYQLTEDGGFTPEPPQVFTLQSAGGLWSTGPDLARFGSGWRTLLPADLAAQALSPQVPQRDVAEETGLGWALRRPMDAAGLAGVGPGWAASLIMRPSTGHTVVVLTNRLLPILAVNVELLRAAGGG